MVQWKTLGSLQDKEVYACIITNLYNEYQYHSRYPLEELQMTGTLFGGLIDKGYSEGLFYFKINLV
jgi:CCR4-NOT transcription complex subunit 1